MVMVSRPTLPEAIPWRAYKARTQRPGPNALGMSSVRRAKVYLRPPTIPDRRCDSTDLCPVRVARKRASLPGGVSTTMRDKARPGRDPPPVKRNEAMPGSYASNFLSCRSPSPYGGAAALSLPPSLRQHAKPILSTPKSEPQMQGRARGACFQCFQARSSAATFYCGMWISRR